MMFVLRLVGLSELGHWIASLQFLSVFPLVYLLVKASKFDRPFLYFLQICLFLTFLFIELIIDYILKFDFRQTRWMVIIYVTYFFAATGGLLGLISLMERRLWIISGIVLFMIMAAIAFISRAVTGI
jgi:hypothetical protein